MNHTVNKLDGDILALMPRAFFAHKEQDPSSRRAMELLKLISIQPQAPTLPTGSWVFNLLEHFYY